MTITGTGAVFDSGALFLSQSPIGVNPTGVANPCIYHETKDFKFHGTFTCPNGHIAVLKNFTFQANAADQLRIYKCDSVGARNVVYTSAPSTFINNTTDTIVIYPRETIFFSCISATPASKSFRGVIETYPY